MSAGDAIPGPSGGVPTDAYGAMDAKSELKKIVINRRKPLSKDVVIRILYCGICHTDIHIAQNDWNSTCYPVIPGHEIAGVIEAVGSDAKKFKIGENCGVGFYVDTCQECKQCKDKMEQYCEKGIVIAFNSKDQRNENGCITCGGYSRNIVVNEDYVFKWPETLPMDTGTPLLCAGITMYSPLKYLCREKSSDGGQFRVAILGLGGLGHIAIPIARAMGTHVTAMGRKASAATKGKLALELGAHQYISIESVKDGSSKVDQFDLILDTISVDHDLDEYLNLLKVGGTLVPIGLPGEPMRFKAMSLIMQRRNIMGSVVGSLNETQEMLEFCAKHNIVCMTEVIGMGQVNEAYDRIIKGDVKFRFVIDMEKDIW